MSKRFKVRSNALWFDNPKEVFADSFTLTPKPYTGNTVVFYQNQETVKKAFFGRSKRILKKEIVCCLKGVLSVEEIPDG